MKNNFVYSWIPSHPILWIIKSILDNILIHVTYDLYLYIFISSFHMRTHMNKKDGEKTNQSVSKQVTPVKTKYLVYTFLKLNFI